jgi:hypothetical protein
MATFMNNNGNANLWRRTWQQPSTYGHLPLTKDAFHTAPVVLDDDTPMTEPPTSPTSVASNKVALLGMPPKLPYAAQGHNNNILAFENNGMQCPTNFQIGQAGHVPF